MADINPLAIDGGNEHELSEWPNVVALINPNEYVQGGDEDSPSNKQASRLTRRTRWLRDKLDAMELVFNTNSLTGNGYQKFPGGLIVQWMTGGFRNIEAEYSLDFPIPFTTACLGASVSTHNAEINTVNYTDNDHWFQTRGWNATHVIIQLQTIGGADIATDTMQPFVIAIGH